MRVNLISLITHFVYFIVELRNITRQNTRQVKTAAENCEIPTQEMFQRESECKTIIEQFRDAKDKLFHKDIALREPTTKLEETEEKLLKAEAKILESEAKIVAMDKYIDDLKMLNQRNEQKVNEKVSIIANLQGKLVESEVKLEETKAQLMKTERKLKENELDLKLKKRILRETQQKLQEAEAKQKEFESRITVTHNDADRLILEGRLLCISCVVS